MSHDEKNCCCSHQHQGIQESFQHDHGEIDELLTIFLGELHPLIEKGSMGNNSLIHKFEKFDHRLDQHIRWEEEILFPAVERKNPQIKDGPGKVMRMEHVEIRNLKHMILDELKTALQDATSLQKANSLLGQVISILKSHNMKEEQIYYPMADETLTEIEKKDILSRTTSLSM